MKLVAFITCLLLRITSPEKDSFFCVREAAESKDSLSLHYLSALFFSFCGSNELLEWSLNDSSHTICWFYFCYEISGFSYPTLLVKVMCLWSKIDVSRLGTKNDKFGLVVIKKPQTSCPLTSLCGTTISTTLIARKKSTEIVETVLDKRELYELCFGNAGSLVK